MPFISFLKIFIYFNWKIITLQYCDGFAIHQCELAIGKHMFSHLSPHPIPPGFLFLALCPKWTVPHDLASTTLKGNCITLKKVFVPFWISPD